VTARPAGLVVKNVTSHRIRRPLKASIATFTEQQMKSAAALTILPA
jgi:hypothetical protein